MDDLLNGCSAPSNTEQAVILLNSLADAIKYIKRVKEISDLNKEQRSTLDNVISAVFRFPNNEHVVLGIRKLLDVNRNIVKAALLELDNDQVTNFIKNT